MKKLRITVSLLFAFLMTFAPLSLIAASADDESDTGEYVYTFKVKVDNPVKSGELKGNKISTLFFEFTYNQQNGYGSETKEKFNLKDSGNYEFLRDNFIRKNNDSYSTEFQYSLPGKMTKMYIKLNMDSGERLNFAIKEIYCNGKRINSNTDYVSSAYYDSKANIYTSMEASVIDDGNSPYFADAENDVTLNELKKIAGTSDKSGYEGMFRDQYNADIDISVLDKCISASDGDINQYYSHSDEVSMYKYTLYFNVENPINLNDADKDEVETFYIRMNYIDENGYGSEKTYTLDMAYDKNLKRNRNQKYLSYFERTDDKSANVHFDVWVPGILTKVSMKLNMSGEKLVADLEKVTLNSLAVNTGRDYVSSLYYDSSANVSCSVPEAKINAVKDGVDYSTARDRYGALVSDTLKEKAQNDPDRYFCG